MVGTALTRLCPPYGLSRWDPFHLGSDHGVDEQSRSTDSAAHGLHTCEDPQNVPGIINYKLYSICARKY